MNSKELAYRIRVHAVEMTHKGGSSHVGSVLSMADIVAVLYGNTMMFDPLNSDSPSRDRFILSKGHAGAGIYAALGELGFFSINKLKTHYLDGSDLSGHVSHKRNPGVEISTGSLGHGLPIACGIAKSLKLDQKGQRVFVLMGDGECDEGSNWEAALFASHHQLDNLYAIIDYNKLQSIGLVKDTLNLEPFAEKWRSFGWNVHEVDGHNHEVLSNILNNCSSNNKKPNCIIAHTIKGKGVSFMENSVLWHYRSPQGEEYHLALRELRENNA